MTVESRIGAAGARDARTVREPDKKDVVGSVLTLSVGMVESGVRTTANLGRTVTTESQKVVDAAIQLADQQHSPPFAPPGS